jgi:GT2 family glycosyltransferase
MNRIAVLITCHNRCEITLLCLQALFLCNLPNGFILNVYLVDDGSIDGTGEKVKLKYPDINIIQGTGYLYWSGGTRLAWESAAMFDFDYYLWLNDDTIVFSNAIDELIAASEITNDKAIICGTVTSRLSGLVTYGGKMKSQREVTKPTGKLINCEIINGNLVLVPRAIYQALGPIDSVFTHAIGDWDYGLRAINQGFECYIAPKILGNCERNQYLPNWCRKEVPLLKRVVALYSPLASAQPKPYFIFVARHFGVGRALRQLISMHVRMLFPNLWNHK